MGHRPEFDEGDKELQWHLEDLQELVKRLDSNLDSGLSIEAVAAAQQQRARDDAIKPNDWWLNVAWLPESMRGSLVETYPVTRAGAVTRISKSELLPGDIIDFVQGDRVPADGRILEVSCDASLDMSSLTGESEGQALDQ